MQAVAAREAGQRHSHDGQSSSELLYTSSSGDVKKTEGQLLVKKIIRHRFFDTAMALIIVFNFVTIIIEADATAEEPSGEIPESPKWIQICSWVILILFVIELILRLYVEHQQFFSDGWNNFDFFIITLDTCASLLGLIFSNAFPVSALRILRLCKLARMSKIFRVFPELRLMMAGLIGCMRSIFWGMILLIFALLVWAIMGVQFIHPLNLKIGERGLYEEQNCLRCPTAYDSVAHAMLTLLQQAVAGDSWGMMTVPIIEEYPLASFYFLGVLMTVSMAVLNLILGVVVNVAMESRDELAAQIEKEKLIHRVSIQTNLTQVCSDMDKDGSGELSKVEFISGYAENEAFRNTLSELDIEEDDLDILWTMLDPDKDGQVPYTTFIHKSYSMKESDTQFMLAYIKYYVTKIRDQVLQGQEQLKEYMKGNRNAMEKLQHETERFEHQIEEKMQFDHTEQEVDQSNIQLESLKEDFGSKEPPKAAGLSAQRGPDVPLNLPHDDRKILYDILEKSRQWRDELAASIHGFNARLDSVVQDGVWTPLTQEPIIGMSARLAARPAQAPNKKSVWCCQRDASQRGMESVVGRSNIPVDDIVEPVSGGRSQNSRQRRENSQQRGST